MKNIRECHFKNMYCESCDKVMITYAGKRLFNVLHVSKSYNTIGKSEAQIAEMVFRDEKLFAIDLLQN